MDPEYLKQVDIQKYAEQQRAVITKFIQENKPQFLTLGEVMEKFKGDKRDFKIFAIINPNIVQALSYEPVKQVTVIQEATDEDKDYLKNYWAEKYELDLDELGDITHIVGLLFHGSYWSDYYHEEVYYSKSYTYPGCIISTFLLI